MRFSRDGSRLYVTEVGEGDVAVIDPAAGTVVGHFATGGEEPAGLAMSPDGTQLAVANSGSDSVTLLDARSGARLRRLDLRGSPADAAFSPDGATLAVALCQLNEVAFVDLATGQVPGRVPTGIHPRALVFTGDGSLACLNTTDGSVSLIDPATKREARRLRTPAVNLRGIAARPDGRLLYVTGQRAQNERPTETAIGVWSNQAFGLSVRGGIADNIWLDLLASNAADPDDIVLNADGSRAYIACGGGNSVQSLRPGGNYDAKTALDVGADPRGLALAPDGRQLWVANYLGNDLAVLDAATLQPLRRVPLGKASRANPHILGEYLFRTAAITQGGQFSCNSCHTDGGVDGISWKFVHVHDGLGRELRNVRTLRGPLRETAPFRWTGSTATIEEFIREEVAGLMQGPPLSGAEAQALAAFVTSLRELRNPFRNEDGSFTAAARRGEALFAGKAGCATCHSGPHHGGQRRAWIGTTPEGVDLDVPHLTEVYDTAPYLHDGRADTLEEIFTRHDPQHRHGNLPALTDAEKADLFRFLREL
jgi:YVTN family beta-propeller protein